MQEELFHEDFLSALDHAVKGLGGRKKVASAIWPTKSIEAASVTMSNCFNPSRGEKFDIDDVLTIMKMARDAGVHCAMHTICDVTGYERPAIAAGKTQSQILAEKMKRLAHEFATAADEHAAALASEQSERRYPKAE